MSIGLVGRKCGMTRIFDPNEGVSIPVTVLEVKPNRITQLKTIETDGYSAVQVTMGEQNPSRVTKPLAGHFAKANSCQVEVCGNFVLMQMKQNRLLRRRNHGFHFQRRTKSRCLWYYQRPWIFRRNPKTQF